MEKKSIDVITLLSTG